MQRLLFVVGLGLAACASGSNNATQTTTGTPHMAQAGAAPEDPDVACGSEVRTGTHLEKKICRSQAEKDQDKRAVEELYLSPTARPGGR